MSLSQTESIARALFAHYLPQLRQAHNIRPTRHPNRHNTSGLAEFRRFGFELDNLEADIYFPEIRVVVEVNGIQHGRPIEHFHKTHEDFEKQMEHDARKAKLCREQRVAFYSLTVFQLLESSFEPFIRQFARAHKLTIHPYVQSPTDIYLAAERLSRSKVALVPRMVDGPKPLPHANVSQQSSRLRGCVTLLLIAFIGLIFFVVSLNAIYQAVN